MQTTVIHAGKILTPEEEIDDAIIVVEGSRIAAIGHRDEIRVPADAVDYVAAEMTVVPGFVDVHIHGAGGHDVMDGNARALDRIAWTVASHGTTSLVATTVTAPIEQTCHSLEGIARYIRSHEQLPEESTDSPEDRKLAAEFVGIHLEGPFISKARRGVHPPDSIARPSVEILQKFIDAADGLVKIVTIAPEIPGACELIRYAVAAKIVAAIGHTDADYDQARAAIQAGARHAVHMYNAMRPFTHRDPGVVGAILTDPEVTAEVIADGVHVAGPTIQILLGCKGFDAVLLASDGIAATGMPDGSYRLGNFEVTVKDGVARNSEGKLAGSTLTLDRALRYVVALGVPLKDAVRMATVLPARRLGLAGKKGIIAVGADADLVALTADLRVAGVMTRGAGLT
ncbi:MAG TPA: N-acetylglucosamine-6-phosphate deacetylase [Candidatus Acidoferrales bacterium]|jgi:N-acetylglucosamine-6-phosphate deacetylase|nr:N-acetylglucosamine-6-phosphate deacetylase [Candidatus Acidoferrales bacterium]